MKEVPAASGAADRYVELRGGPDLVVEIVGDASVGKDRNRLPELYAPGRVLQSDHHFDPRSPSAEKCPDRAQERHDAVRWCRLGSTDSAEEPEIVVARAIGGSNDEKPIP